MVPSIIFLELLEWSSFRIGVHIFMNLYTEANVIDD